jgi:hypothetical protein
LSQDNFGNINNGLELVQDKLHKMKKREIEKLLGLLDNKDQSHDFSGYSNPDEAKESFVKLGFLRNKLNEREKSFSPYFTEKVMGKISVLTTSPGLEEYLSMLLTRVMTYGISAVLLIFLTLYLFHGQEGIGTVIGTSDSNDINFISYLFYEF